MTKNDGIIDGGTWSASAMVAALRRTNWSKNSAFWVRVRPGRKQRDSTADRRSVSRGYWGGNPRDKYLGARFQIHGQFHYGWIRGRLTVTTSKQVHGPILSAEITGVRLRDGGINQANQGGSCLDGDSRGSGRRISSSKLDPRLACWRREQKGMPLWRREETSVQ